VKSNYEEDVEFLKSSGLNMTGDICDEVRRPCRDGLFCLGVLPGRLSPANVLQPSGLQEIKLRHANPPLNKTSFHPVELCIRYSELSSVSKT
jgi:hypothetical protein